MATTLLLGRLGREVVLRFLLGLLLVSLQKLLHDPPLPSWKERDHDAHAVRKPLHLVLELRELCANIAVEIGELLPQACDAGGVELDLRCGSSNRADRANGQRRCRLVIRIRCLGGDTRRVLRVTLPYILRDPTSSRSKVPRLVGPAGRAVQRWDLAPKVGRNAADVDMQRHVVQAGVLPCHLVADAIKQVASPFSPVHGKTRLVLRVALSGLQTRHLEHVLLVAVLQPLHLIL
mmetsp:Transcript_78638/g.174140  ORF Transcript_78638/g.174140 Transcript_78638/m.174140 type:complete len:234 (-) Transcript_78638:141-842(-)